MAIFISRSVFGIVYDGTETSSARREMIYRLFEVSTRCEVNCKTDCALKYVKTLIYLGRLSS